MRKIIILTASCLIALNLYAQIATNEEPIGLQTGFRGTFQESINIAAPDIGQIRKEEKDLGLVPYAYACPVKYTLENSGVWQTLEDGSRLWRLKVSLPGALSTNTYYDRFWLPEGGKFFVYSEDTKQSIGAITSEFIKGSRESPIQFATALIYGETVVYEYYQPVSIKETPVIIISRIDYGYQNINNPYAESTRASGYGTSGLCMVNINCSEGNNWQTEKHAVARISVRDNNGSYWGSGALINNTKNDYTPYVLTAHHVINAVGSDAIDNPDANQWIFYWEYERSGCSNSTIEPTHRTTTGAVVVANAFVSDFALLKLTQNPRCVSGVTPYYLGWDRSGNSGTGGVGIHHPSGDVKKISTHNITPSNSNCYSAGSSYLSLQNWNFWKINWMQTPNGFSVTEGGSSGSPLLNNNKRVIGQLHGAGTFGYCDNTDCSNPALDISNYGKFSVSWTGDGNSDYRRRLNYWLDPNGANVTTLNGVSPPPCPSIVNLIGTVSSPIIVSTTTTYISCGNIIVQYVKVQNGAKLILDAEGEVYLNNDFEVALGSELEII